MKGTVAAASIVISCACGGRATTDTVTVESSMSTMPASRPMSVAMFREGGTITLALVAAFDDSGSCDVFRAVDPDDVAWSTQIIVSFPAGVSPGEYSLADVGAVATYRVNDGLCAPYTDTATDGTLYVSAEDQVGRVWLTFPGGIVAVDAIVAPQCSVRASPSTCQTLPTCPAVTGDVCW